MKRSLNLMSGTISETRTGPSLLASLDANRCGGYVAVDSGRRCTVAG